MKRPGRTIAPPMEDAPKSVIHNRVLRKLGNYLVPSPQEFTMQYSNVIGKSCFMRYMRGVWAVMMARIIMNNVI